jgi:hypothetical protein
MHLSKRTSDCSETCLIPLEFCSTFCVHGSVHRESMSIIVQQDVTVYIFIIFMQTALHVSDDNFTHNQEHT